MLVCSSCRAAQPPQTEPSTPGALSRCCGPDFLSRIPARSPRLRVCVPISSSSREPSPTGSGPHFTFIHSLKTAISSYSQSLRPRGSGLPRGGLEEHSSVHASHLLRFQVEMNFGERGLNSVFSEGLRVVGGKGGRPPDRGWGLQPTEAPWRGPCLHKPHTRCCEGASSPLWIAVERPQQRPQGAPGPGAGQPPAEPARPPCRPALRTTPAAGRGSRGRHLSPLPEGDWHRGPSVPLGAGTFPGNLPFCL